MIDHSSQDHLGTKMHDLDHPIVFQCKKTPTILLWRSNRLSNRMEWENGILGPKENCEEEFELLQFK
jgi:hypothetical protein